MVVSRDPPEITAVHSTGKPLVGIEVLMLAQGPRSAREIGKLNRGVPHRGEGSSN
jgi:hypothetical protein